RALPLLGPFFWQIRKSGAGMRAAAEQKDDRRMRLTGRPSWLYGVATGLGLSLALGGCAEDSLVLPENAAPAVVSPVAGDGQEGRTGEGLDVPLVVEVRDDDGLPLPEVRVVFGFAGGSAGQLGPAEAHTN